MSLLIKEEEVTKAISYGDLVEAMEDMYKKHGLGLAETFPRREVRIRGKDLPHADPRMVRVAQCLAYMEQPGVVLLHHIFSFPDRRTPSMRVINHLIDADSGSVIAIIDSVNILGMRTGAAGAVGAKFLSRKDSRVAGIVGAGRQGRIQLKFLLEIRPIEKAYVYDKVRKHAIMFSKEMSRELEIDLLPSDDIEKVTRHSDILVTATPSMTPIVKGEWLSPGIHVNIIGADDPPKIELEGEALRKADKLVIMAEDCFAAGQLKIPMDTGILSKKDVYGTLGEIIAGIKPARESDDEITIYHNPGMTLHDLAAAYKVYTRAKELGLGIEVPDPFEFS